jgi:hypothetical protein
MHEYIRIQGDRYNLIQDSWPDLGREIMLCENGRVGEGERNEEKHVTIPPFGPETSQLNSAVTFGLLRTSSRSRWRQRKALANRRRSFNKPSRKYRSLRTDGALWCVMLYLCISGER